MTLLNMQNKVSQNNRNINMEEPPARDPDDETVITLFNVENSNNIIIGGVTHFHSPVTVLKQVIESNNPPPNQENQHFCLKSVYGGTICIASTTTILLLLLAGVIVLLTRNSNKSPSIFMNNNDRPSTNIQIIPRSFWGARAPLNSTVLDTPVPYIVISHTMMKTCNTSDECASILKTIQAIDVEEGYPDLRQNFLIGSDANIYVGRGWDVVNDIEIHSIAVAFIGDYNYDPFTKSMQATLKFLINLGVQKGKIESNYTLLSHSQIKAVLSPGSKIRNVIRTWPRYYPNDYIELID